MDSFHFAPLAPFEAVPDPQLSLAEAHREARAAGYTEGYEAGLAAAAEHTRTAVDALAALLAQAEARQSQYLQRAEDGAVDLALALAAKITGQTFAADPRLVLESVAGVLRRTTARDHLTVAVNPADLELVSATCSSLMDVIADRRVPRGGCILDTGEGEIDATLHAQLERADEVIRAALAEPADA